MQYSSIKPFLPHPKSLTAVAVLSAGWWAIAAAGDQARAQTPLRQGSDAAIAAPVIAQSSNDTNDLPDAVYSAVVADIAERTDLPIANLGLVEAEQRDWPDGCLGIAEPGTLCTQAIVPGWQVVISDGQQEWVYRTNDTGSQIKLADSPTSPGDDSSYSDLEGHWAQSCIQRLSQEAILSGYPDNTFRPNNPITRAEYAALLTQAFPDIAPEREAINFTDVPVFFWGQEAIQTAYRQGFLSGYPDQQFRPNDRISRVETYVSLASGLDYAIPAAPNAILTTAYSDASTIPSYAEGQVAAATQAGIVVQSTPGAGALNPADPATRAQMAATLCQIKFDDPGIPAGYLVNPVEDPEEDNAVNLSQTCTNEAAGYTVRYPTGWLTNAGDVVSLCHVFDPETITLPEQSSSFDEAIHLRVENTAFERATAPDDITETELSRRTTTVDGYETVVTESETTGRGLLPGGIRNYTYIIDLPEGDIMVASTYDVEGQQYARNKQVLDQMMDSLSFNR